MRSADRRRADEIPVPVAGPLGDRLAGAAQPAGEVLEPGQAVLVGTLREACTVSLAPWSPGACPGRRGREGRDEHPDGRAVQHGHMVGRRSGGCYSVGASACSCRRATTSPASQPGARPPAGRRTASAGRTRIVAQSLRARDRLGHVGDDAVAPAAYLVPEDPEAPCPAAADRASGDDAAPRPVAGGDRGHLDDVLPLRHAHLQRGVVEVADGSPLEP
jgi:hypothetical protein